MNSFDEMYERIKIATNARTQVELAAMLEIRQSSISDAKRRRSIPADWFIKLHDKFGLNIDWLRWKTGPMRSRDFVGRSDDVPGVNFGNEGFGGSVDAAELSGESGEDQDQNGGPLAREQGKSGLLTPVVPGAASSAALENSLDEPLATSQSVSAILREEAPNFPVPRGVLSRILHTACDYVEGEGTPDFAVRDYMVLPKTLMAEGLLVFYVDTGGMEPTLRKGACVGVSTAQRRLASGEVYALLMPHEGVAFRRIVQDSESGLFLLCFERHGLPATRMPAQVLQARIVGKVLWTLQPV